MSIITSGSLRRSVILYPCERAEYLPLGLCQYQVSYLRVKEQNIYLWVLDKIRYLISVWKSWIFTSGSLTRSGILSPCERAEYIYLWVLDKIRYLISVWKSWMPVELWTIRQSLTTMSTFIGSRHITNYKYAIDPFSTHPHPHSRPRPDPHPPSHPN